MTGEREKPYHSIVARFPRDEQPCPCGARLFLSGVRPSVSVMKIVVNGETMVVPDHISLQGMLDSLKMSPDRVAVELNRSIVDRDAFGSSMLSEGDRVEIIGFVGGGLGHC